MYLKSRISRPLEAGTSVLDAHQLPPCVIPALDYASRRFARKGLHVTLVVARRGYQLPRCTTKSIISPDVLAESPMSIPPTPPLSPKTPEFLAHGAGLPAVIKSLVRSGSQHSLEGSCSAEPRHPPRSRTWGPSRKASLASLIEAGLGSPRLRRTAAPKTPATPATPITPASSLSSSSTTASSTPTSSAAGPLLLELQDPGVCLLHTMPLDARARKLVAATLARATRKFGVALAAHDAAAYDVPAGVLHGSILQNEVLHASAGLTLLSMDHLYTFKSALCHYSATRIEPGDVFRLEDAVDELRRYVLWSAAGRRRLRKSVLLQAYGWLGPVSDSALGDVMDMYCQAYGGGVAEETGVENDLVAASPVEAATTTTTTTTQSPKRQGHVQVPAMIPIPQPPPPPPPRSPARSDRPVVAVAESGVAPNKKSQADEGTANEASPLPPTVQESAMLGEAQDALQTASRTPPAMSPRRAVAPRPSLPSLKLQTTNLTLTNSSGSIKKPVPRRKGTPAPQKCASRRSSAQTGQDPGPPPLPAAQQKEEEEEEDDDDDGGVTARPGKKNGGAALWDPGSSIDEILGGGGSWKQQQQQQQQRGHRRRSSSLYDEMQAQERLGPSTPNGYDDISPITRGEWGFLMVSDPFKTKTAAVSCV